MKKLLLITLAISLAVPPASAGDGLFGLFGGRRRQQVQVVHCQPQTYAVPTYAAPVYQQQYVAPVVVAALPYAGLVVNSDAYQYGVDFRSFAQYQAAKATSQPPNPTPNEVAQPQPARVASATDDPRALGAQVLKANCLACHQKGRNPKAGFSIFDEKGDMYTSLPFSEMLERMTAEDPSVRMPPRKTLASHDIMSVFRLASVGIEQPEVRTAANSEKTANPFD